MQANTQGPSHILKLEHPQSVAIYDEYSDAQKAVDYLSDNGFPVQNLAIVGTDLRSFEKVTGTLSWGKVIGASVLQGIMWALTFAVIMVLLFPGSGFFATFLVGVLGFSIMSIIVNAMQYWALQGRRDFTSMSGIVATHYEIMAEAEVAGRARKLLSGPSGTDPQQAEAKDLASMQPPFGQTPTSTPRGYEAPAQPYGNQPPIGQPSGQQPGGLRGPAQGAHGVQGPQGPQAPGSETPQN